MRTSNLKTSLAALLAIAAVATASVGCVFHTKPSFPLTTSTSKPLHPKEPGCTFHVRGAFPKEDEFEEIGSMHSAGYAVDNPNQFKASVAADVCRVGGDIVVTEVNGYGQIVRGTVFRRIPQTANEPSKADGS